jgi:hypothetical protein
VPIYLHQIDLRVNKITRDKEGYYIMIHQSLHQKDRQILNVYTPINGASKYVGEQAGR